jgi:hypothetical protein
MKKQHQSNIQNTAQLQARISVLEAMLLEKEAVISKKETVISEKDFLISEKDSLIEKLNQDAEYLAFQNDQMRRLIFGSKQERFIPEVHPDQLTLSFEEEVAAVSKTIKEEQEKIRIEYQRGKVRKELRDACCCLIICLSMRSS